MSQIPASIERFLASERIAVAGVSRDSNQPANHILRRLRDTGHEVVALNPAATEVEGQRCYPDLASVPEKVDALMVVTSPDAAPKVVREAISHGVRQVWFHRAIGDGSVSREAVWECEEAGIEPLVGGCPMMFCGRVDVGHRFFRWFLKMRRRLPG
jgi:predicted CoA-binding protein